MTGLMASSGLGRHSDTYMDCPSCLMLLKVYLLFYSLWYVVSGIVMGVVAVNAAVGSW